jgi:Trk-type K+ transport system membrane component
MSEDSILVKVAKGFVVLCNFGFPTFLAACGALALKETGEDPQVAFMGIYVFIFATVLFLYEALQILPFPSLDFMYKKNFGFLYGNSIFFIQ